MEEIIKPVSKELLKAELTEDRRLRMISENNSQVYIITHQNAPSVMREIGRLREIAFHVTGGETGLSVDIDKYDTMEHPYKQLIVWNPKAEEISGGHRYLLGTDARFDEAGTPILATSHIFHFSDTSIKGYLFQTIELGRFFVTLECRFTRVGSKGLFVLDNLRDGLGTLTVVMPNVKYFFSKVTIYPSYHCRGCDMILYFLRKHFNDQEESVTSMEPLILETSDEELRALSCKDTFKEDCKILNTEIRRLGYSILPLVNAYMSSSPAIRTFGTAISYEFDDMEETGILIAVDEILEDKRIWYIQMFIESRPGTLKMPCESEEVSTLKMVTPQEGCCH